MNKYKKKESSIMFIPFHITFNYLVLFWVIVLFNNIMQNIVLLKKQTNLLQDEINNIKSNFTYCITKSNF
jgi:Ni/Fe-hydrogenase subunit HybB-like protein